VRPRGARGAAIGAAALGILASLTIGGTPRAARGDVTFRRAGERSPWPAGTERVPFESRGGTLLFDALLRSPSGRTLSGPMILDTGAPTVVVTMAVWNGLGLDTLEADWNFMRRVRRSLASVEMGSARVPNLEVGGVVSDTVLVPSEALGLFGPSVIRDRAIAIDYAAGEWAIVPPGPSVVNADSAVKVGPNLGRDARIRRSRVAYASVVAPGAIAVPFRLFEGGRILVNVRVAEPGQRWSGAPLTMLLDTGASVTVLFDDVLAERVSRARSWARLHDIEVRTVLGASRAEATVLPSLELLDAATPLAVSRVEAAIEERKTLPDLEGELPERIHGLLGDSFLRRFRLVLDYGNQVLWLEPREGAAGVEDRPGPLGLRLEQRWGGLRVAAVAPGSAAEGAGLSIGDVVVSIDGRSVGDRDPADAERMLEGPPGSTVTIVARREGVERVLRLERRGPR
jgi:predicted aspartyl protease